MVVQALGYFASLLVFCAFYMRTMLPLRYVAIASNVAFISYGVPLALWPVVGLHVLLLPLNVLRLFQIRRMLASLRATPKGEVDVQSLVSCMRMERHAQGAVLFRKGGPGESAYYIAKGKVEFPELGGFAGPGEIFGEIGVFSPQRVRTASAVCASDVELYRIDGDAITAAFHQSPTLALALMRLMLRRLADTIGRLEAETARTQPRGTGGGRDRGISAGAVGEAGSERPSV
jgi:hypothetical protein